MKVSWFSILFTVLLFLPGVNWANTAESFTITTHNVVVKEVTDTDIQLRSENNSYLVKLEPTKKGKVIFSLSNIGYRSTMRVPNFTFEVKITGYKDGETISPTFSIDDVNREIQLNRNAITFKRIHGTIPVWFDTELDSINLEYSNSHALNVQQYLRIQDLKIIPLVEVLSNPTFKANEEGLIMVGLDGSSSIDKQERIIVAKNLINFVKQTKGSKNYNELCVMEFGSEILSVEQSPDAKKLTGIIKKYKKDKNDSSKYTSWTNWSVAFDEAIARKPALFIFITDGWSNWKNDTPSSFTAQYQDLITKTNQLKENGTRLVFITSNMDVFHTSTTILNTFLSQDKTQYISRDAQIEYAGLKNIELISMSAFDQMEGLNLAELVR